MHDHDCDGCDEKEPCDDCQEAAKLKRMSIPSIAIRTRRSYPPEGPVLQSAAFPA